MRVHIVAPGSVYSTFDVYRNILMSFGRVDEVEVSGFPFHNYLVFYEAANEWLKEKHSTVVGGMYDGIAWSARQLLLDIWEKRPDVVVFVDGSKFPQKILYEVHKFCNAIGLNTIVCGYITEAPYINDSLEQLLPFFDVVFTNERNHADRLNPNGDKFVFYAPPCYSNDIHWHKSLSGGNKEYEKEVFFCGTLFPERINLLRELDTSGFDLSIFANTSVIEDRESIDIIKKKTTFSDGIVDNTIVAEYYRRSKVLLNIHRTYGWDFEQETKDIALGEAYSINPRVIEAVACGGFVLTDHRPELDNLFGDTIATYDGPRELREKALLYLGNDELRENMSAAALEKIKGMSYV
ncbi:MAG: glycosyltransferase [Nanoarchaeota archaeon]|nr:glycosyltransferase [Nanoarchaeota archaeon]